MTPAVEPEIMDSPDRKPEVRLVHLRGVGLLGTALAILTMFAAFGVGFLMLFGTTLLAAFAMWIVWPLVFSTQFTQWVFGTERVEFWKLFLLFLVAGTVVRMWRQSWQRK